MNQTREEFLRRHAEHAQRLDDLAGELQTLDLSEISHKVGDFTVNLVTEILAGLQITHFCWYVLCGAHFILTVSSSMTSTFFWTPNCHQRVKTA